MWEESAPASAPAPQQPAARRRNQPQQAPSAASAVADHRVLRCGVDTGHRRHHRGRNQRHRTQRAIRCRRPRHRATHKQRRVEPCNRRYGRGRRRPVACHHASRYGVQADREVHSGSAQRRRHSAVDQAARPRRVRRAHRERPILRPRRRRLERHANLATRQRPQRTAARRLVDHILACGCGRKHRHSQRPAGVAGQRQHLRRGGKAHVLVAKAQRPRRQREPRHPRPGQRRALREPGRDRPKRPGSCTQRRRRKHHRDRATHLGKHRYQGAVVRQYVEIRTRKAHHRHSRRKGGVVGPGKSLWRTGESDSLGAKVLRRGQKRGLPALVRQLEQHVLQQLLLRSHRRRRVALVGKDLTSRTAAILHMVLVVQHAPALVRSRIGGRWNRCVKDELHHRIRNAAHALVQCQPRLRRRNHASLIDPQRVEIHLTWTRRSIDDRKLKPLRERLSSREVAGIDCRSA